MTSIRWAVVFVVAFPAALLAQSTEKTVNAESAAKPKAQATRSRSGSNPDKDSDPSMVEKRSIAIETLSSLAIEARSYRDEALRARVQARVADALWESDATQARALFHRAWDVAEAVELQPSEPGTSGPGRVPTNRATRDRGRICAQRS